MSTHFFRIYFIPFWYSKMVMEVILANSHLDLEALIVLVLVLEVIFYYIFSGISTEFLKRINLFTSIPNSLITNYSLVVNYIVRRIIVLYLIDNLINLFVSQLDLNMFILLLLIKELIYLSMELLRNFISRYMLLQILHVLIIVLAGLYVYSKPISYFLDLVKNINLEISTEISIFAILGLSLFNLLLFGIFPLIPSKVTTNKFLQNRLFLNKYNIVLINFTSRKFYSGNIC